MRLVLFVHDCFLEIGHSNAIIETLRKVPPSEVDHLEVVAFTCDDMDKLFPDLNGRVSFTKVPFPKLYPVMIKIIFFHLWCFFYGLFKIPKECVRIGIGIAAMNVDVVNIQFVHAHWNKFFFSYKKISPFAYIYKKVLFCYFGICERFLFKKDKLQFSVLAQFVTDFLKGHFLLPSERVHTVYSSVNTKKFHPVSYDRKSLWEDLKSSYPILKNLDISRPIHLFVGAYERKGLPFVFKALNQLERPQLIIVGGPESHGSFFFPADIECFPIQFTKELPKFYSLCDSFIFPTLYEPFGLVITEAASCGMEVYVTKENVGAPEILENLDGIHIFNTQKEVIVSEEKIVSKETRKHYHEQRLVRFNEYSWKKAGEKFLEILKKANAS